MMDRTKWNQRTPTSWIAVTALLVFACFWVACGGGAGSVNSTGWNAITTPKLTGLSPASGPTTGGTTVAITGTDFQQGATVVFGNVPAAKINSVTSTSIEAVTPVHDAGNVDVTVTNPDTRSDTLLVAFTFAGSPPPIGGPAPTISSVLPNSGPVIGGTVVTITGTDFQSGATVTFGQSPAAAVVFNSATQLKATTPAHAAGPVDVIVRNPDTQSATVSGGFTYQPVPAPTIISLLPTSGPEAGGTLVTVWGTNFLAGATVSFGGVAAASVTVTSATQLGAVTPPHAAGVVDVRVTNLDDQFATLVGAFTYGTPPPTILSVAPSSGSTAGGTPVTITGTGFQPAVPDTMVTFGGVAGTGVNVLSSTKIQVATPAHAVGPVPVQVTNPDGQFATAAGGYAYVTSPVIAGLSVDSGLSIGGTPVTITGSNFAGGAAVTFGAVDAASVNVVSSTRIDVTTPPGTAGTTVDVTVTNPAGGGTFTLPNAFRYGTILLSSSFETGDFSEWSGYYQHNPNVNSVITGVPGGDVHSGTKAYRIHFVICGIDVPAATTLSQTSGSHPGTYYVRYTYYTTDGFEGANHPGETKASVEQSFTVTAGNDLTVASPPAAIGLTGWNVYISDTTGNEKKQNTTPIPLGTDWTQNAALLTGTTAPPTTNTACGGAQQDNNQGVYQMFRTAQGYPTGLHHVFVRGWVKFHANAGETNPDLGHIQRKTFYLKGAIANQQFGYAATVTTYAPDNTLTLRMTYSVYAPPRASNCDPVGIYGAEGVLFTYTYDTWYAVEFEWLQNSAPGVADGAYWVWVTPEGGATQLVGGHADRSTSGDCTAGVDSITVGEQVNRYYAADVVDEYRYWDDVIIADAYIGP